MQNKNTLLDKILKGKLTDQEEANLLNSPSAVERQRKEWDHSSHLDYAESVDGAGQLKKIQSAIWREKSLFPSYKKFERSLTESILGADGWMRTYARIKTYAIAASIIACLFLGTTLWFYQKATTVPATATVYVVTNGRQQIETIHLSDGSSVVLGAGSKLTYPKEFTGKKRLVELQGQAFFEVAKNPQKPFIVKTSQMEVTAIGTAFEVFCFGKEMQGEAILLNGAVKVALPQASSKENKEVFLLPNEKVTTTKDGEVNIEKVDANTYSSWRNKNGLSFANEKMSMIIPRLEKWYGTKIVCNEEIAQQYRFSFIIEDEPLTDIMNIIDRISPLSVKKEGNTYVITKQTN